MASAFRDLALELAFRIMSAEPALASVGMTRSWEAFDRFRQGLEFWQRYAVQSGEQDPDALTQAIRGFRAAIGVDPTFASGALPARPARSRRTASRSPPPRRSERA